MNTVKGSRVYPDTEGRLWLAEGAYGKSKEGVWYARPFGQHTGSLEKHSVVEHDDGTITVSPSILIRSHKGVWHGYLENGVWREV